MLCRFYVSYTFTKLCRFYCHLILIKPFRNFATRCTAVYPNKIKWNKKIIIEDKLKVKQDACEGKEEEDKDKNEDKN